MPKLSLSQIDNSFSAMATLKPLAAKGKGNVTVILPDTVSSTRYVEFDAPYLKESFQKAGLKSSQYTVENALGSDATQFSDAQTAITEGATVLVVDALNSGVGAHVESFTPRPTASRSSTTTGWSSAASASTTSASTTSRLAS